MSAGPALSVIMSTRNRARYLPDVLATLAAQQCDVAFEVIVIDNGSTDDTPAVMEEWCRRDPRFRTAGEPVPGLSRGKNAGIRMAQGSLLLFTDDDMQIAPGWLAAYRSLFKSRRDAPVVAGGTIIPIPHDLGPWPPWLTQAALVDAGLLDHRSERPLARYEYLWGGNMAVPKLLFDRLGPWDETAGLAGEKRVTREDPRFFEDTEFQDRARGAGVAVWFCPGAVVRHRVPREGVTPRRITATAFARGRDSIWVAGSAPRRSSLRCLAGLAGSLFAWGVASIRFRFSPSQHALDRARAGAFVSGQWLDRLRAGRTSLGLFRTVGRATFAVRSILLRLLPDMP